MFLPILRILVTSWLGSPAVPICLAVKKGTKFRLLRGLSEPKREELGWGCLQSRETAGCSAGISQWRTLLPISAMRSGPLPLCMSNSPVFFLTLWTSSPQADLLLPLLLPNTQEYLAMSRHFFDIVLLAKYIPQMSVCQE